jgi:hypothetical protein
MDSSLQDLCARLEHLSEQFRELREGVQKAIHIAEADPEMALTRARKVLEYVVRDVYERRVQEPPGTRPLENLLQRLVKEGYFPDRLDAYANTIRKLGNVGTHSFGETVTIADVYHSLTQLMLILEWYFEVERPEALSQELAPIRPAPRARGRPADKPSAASPPTSLTIVPKGLRSFDAHDASFFLDLLPGPRDKDGLPESIRFWKHRIEERGDLTFTVGVIYGPSGCGKSSLVKAGLLPRLAGHLRVVDVEATVGETEARLLNGLRKRCPDLPGDLELCGTIAALRRGQGLRPGQKVLLVMDQFEQWLYAKGREADAELVGALRQCDGEHVQGLVLVRDDFWMALTRLMGNLDIDLVQGQNMVPVDLFDPIHARHVLAAFGRAFGRLPETPSKEQAAFLDQAVQGLSQDGRVISVRLVLFAEMVKGKPWRPATLKELGGMEGVGVTFLEDTFAAPTAPPHYRLQQRPAQVVLKALLPDTGTDLRGNVRALKELRTASGYADRPRDFEKLLRILDGELRLITPAAPDGSGDGKEPEAATAAEGYQLTHDYLVPSIREWLTRKQKGTRRGRAELRLAERTAAWAGKRETRQLLAGWEWLTVRLLTCRASWTQPQGEMMRVAGRYHGRRALLLGVVLAASAWVGYEANGRIRAHAFRDRLLTASPWAAGQIIAEMARYDRWTNPLLREDPLLSVDNVGPRSWQVSNQRTIPFQHGLVDREQDRRLSDPDSCKRWRLLAALVRNHREYVEPLYAMLLDADADSFDSIRDVLSDYKEELESSLWAVVADKENNPDTRRFRAACALAKYAPTDPRWQQAAGNVLTVLLSGSQLAELLWQDKLFPVKDELLKHLEGIAKDPSRSQELRLRAQYVIDSYRVAEERGSVAAGSAVPTMYGD